MSNNPFLNEDLLCRIEANDPDHDSSILIKIPPADEVSYELIDRVGRDLANSTRIRHLALINTDAHAAGWMGKFHLLELISKNRSITGSLLISTSNKGRALPLSGNTATAKNGETTLTGLSYCFGDIGDDGAEAIVEYLELANDAGILTLNLSSSYFGARGFQHIARAIAGRDFPLQDLLIESNVPNPLLADFAAAFLNSPDSIPNLLTLSGLHICEAGGNAFGSVLVRRMTPLKCLSLRVGEDDHAGVVGVMALLQVLSNNPSKTPKIIHFTGPFGRFYNDFVGRIEAIVRYQMCSMENLYVRFSGLTSVSSSDFHRRITSACCNEESINATYFSNHKLTEVDGACPKLEYYLTMNQNTNKKKVARSKVCDTHLARNFQPDYFKGMKPSLLPKVLPAVNQVFVDHEELTSGARATMDGDCDGNGDGDDEPRQATNNSLSTHFMLIKNNPSLFDHLLANQH